MGRYSAELRVQDGYNMIVLKDSASDSIAKLIPDIGNNLFSFQHGGHDVIKTAVSLQTLQNETFACSKYGTPILFPPNRVREGTYTFNGRTYQLPINEPPHHHLHGELISRAWHLVEFGALDGVGAWAKSRFSFSEHPDIMAYYPHELAFTITYRLVDGKLHMESSIANDGTDEAPFAYGLHPYFSVPYESDNKVILQVPAKDEWPVSNQAFVTDLPSETSFSRSIREEGINLSDYPVLGCSLLTLDQAADSICRIGIPQRGYSIAYQLDKAFPYVLLFRPNWDDAFSIEPYTYVTDAFNLPYASELTGAQGIRPGEVRRLTTALWTEPN
ncbi:aldose 1-epimerase [Paenibacillus albus]|uniref:Aldose 1-epimerase n=1 Tax=Paenibacillus albus TaxID=2495582 RepID=A0A3S9ABF8_9BACL|nr:aldose 1-epimerase [Paenibacillus albus]AZN43083.1 aldose 1-epimerase [Paenibacillus albus]